MNAQRVRAGRSATSQGAFGRGTTTHRRGFLALLAASPLALVSCAKSAPAATTGTTPVATPPGKAMTRELSPSRATPVVASPASTAMPTPTSPPTPLLTATPALQKATVRPAILVAAVADGNVSVLDSRSGSVSRLTSDGINTTPQWTADGRTLFFTKQPFGKPAQTWRWQVGSSAIQVQAGVWSPDGSAVAFSRPVTGGAAGPLRSGWSAAAGAGRSRHRNQAGNGSR
jgi:hypothetical protein